MSDIPFAWGQSVEIPTEQPWMMPFGFSRVEIETNGPHVALKQIWGGSNDTLAGTEQNKSQNTFAVSESKAVPAVSMEGEKVSATLSTLEAPKHLVFKPLPPREPFVFKFESPLTLKEGEETSFNIKIPLRLGLELKGCSLDVMNVAIHPLKYNIFGSTTTGQRSTVMLYQPEGAFETSGLAFANTVVYLENRSRRDWILQKLLLPTNYINLYLQENSVVTENLHFSFRGRLQYAKCIYGATPFEMGQSVIYECSKKLDVTQSRFCAI